MRHSTACLCRRGSDLSECPAVLSLNSSDVLFVFRTRGAFMPSPLASAREPSSFHQQDDLESIGILLRRYAWLYDSRTKDTARRPYSRCGFGLWCDHSYDGFSGAACTWYIDCHSPGLHLKIGYNVRVCNAGW